MSPSTSSETVASAESSVDKSPESPSSIRPDRSVAAPDRPRRGLRLALVVALLVTAGDQLTKWLALRNLDYGTPVDVFWTLDWNLVFNTGSAFSLGTGIGSVLGVVSIVIVLVVLVLAARTPRSDIALLLGGVAGGAIGNVLDRLFRVGDCVVGDCEGFMGGAVVDFIDLNWWPVFNVADMFVVVGAISLAVLGLFDEHAFGQSSDT